MLHRGQSLHTFPIPLLVRRVASLERLATLHHPLSSINPYQVFRVEVLIGLYYTKPTEVGWYGFRLVLEAFFSIDTLCNSLQFCTNAGTTGPQAEACADIPAALCGRDPVLQNYFQLVREKTRLSKVPSWNRHISKYQEYRP